MKKKWRGLDRDCVTSGGAAIASGVLRGRSVGGKTVGMRSRTNQITLKKQASSEPSTKLSMPDSPLIAGISSRLDRISRLGQRDKTTIGRACCAIARVHTRVELSQWGVKFMQDLAHRRPKNESIGNWTLIQPGIISIVFDAKLRVHPPGRVPSQSRRARRSARQ